MEFKFITYGHENILLTQRNTIEFTKDKDLTLQGDCIVGVNSDFDFIFLRKFLDGCKEKGVKQLVIEFGVAGVFDAVVFEPNYDFKDEEEIVIRKTDFLSDRTFGINADKAAKNLNRELVELLKNPEQKIEVVIKEK